MCWPPTLSLFHVSYILIVRTGPVCNFTSQLDCKDLSLFQLVNSIFFPLSSLLQHRVFLKGFPTFFCPVPGFCVWSVALSLRMAHQITSSPHPIFPDIKERVLMFALPFNVYYGDTIFSAPITGLPRLRIFCRARYTIHELTRAGALPLNLTHRAMITPAFKPVE